MSARRHPQLLAVSLGLLACTSGNDEVDAGPDAPAAGRFEVSVERLSDTPCDDWSAVPHPVPVPAPLADGAAPVLVWSWDPYADALVTGALRPHVGAHATRLLAIGPTGNLWTTAPDDRSLVQVGRDGRARWILQLGAIDGGGGVSPSIAVAPDGSGVVAAAGRFHLISDDGEILQERPAGGGAATNFAIGPGGRVYYLTSDGLVATCRLQRDLWRARVVPHETGVLGPVGQIDRFFVTPRGDVVASVMGATAQLVVRPDGEARWSSPVAPAPAYVASTLRGYGRGLLHLTTEIGTDPSWDGQYFSSSDALLDETGAAPWASEVRPSLEADEYLLTGTGSVYHFGGFWTEGPRRAELLAPPDSEWTRPGVACPRPADGVTTSSGALICADRAAGAVYRLRETDGSEAWRVAPRTDLRAPPDGAAMETRVLLDRDGILYIVLYPSAPTTIYGSQGWVYAFRTDSLPPGGDHCSLPGCNRFGANWAFDYAE